MAKLPTDIILKILSKLPVKSLFRFQSVSKTWKSLIKSPHFIKTHLHESLTSHSNLHLLISPHYDSSSLHSSQLTLSHNKLTTTLSFSPLHHPLLPNHPYLNLLGSLNGVVCISTISKTDVFLFNPLIASCHHKLPPREIPAPNLGLLVLGFGYDPIDDDYKVLRIVQGLGLLTDSKNKAQVYSLNNSSWKSVQSMPYYLYYGYYHGVFVNGHLHYLVTRQPSDASLSIAGFDVRNESFSLLDCPDYGDRYKSDSPNSAFMLVELGGCLCLLTSCYIGDGGLDNEFTEDMDGDELDARVLECVDLWGMKEYGNNESWVRLFSIRPTQSIGSYKFIKPLVYSSDGRRVLLETDGWGYIWYHLDSGSVERITVRGLRPNGRFNTRVFVGSLVMLHVDPQKEVVATKNNKKKISGDDFLSVGFKLRL